MLECSEEVFDQFPNLLNDEVDMVFGDVIGWRDDNVVSCCAAIATGPRVNVDIVRSLQTCNLLACVVEIPSGELTQLVYPSGNGIDRVERVLRKLVQNKLDLRTLVLIAKKTR
jgi:hypothetical protein